MDFTLIFKTRDVFASYPIQVNTREAGMSQVKQARYMTGVKFLDYKKVSRKITGIYLDPHIKLDEEVAEQSGLFEEQNTIEVTVPCRYLDKYVTENATVFKDEKSGEIKEVKFYYGYDADSIIEDWVLEGYPTEWGFDGERKS